MIGELARMFSNTLITKRSGRLAIAAAVGLVTLQAPAIASPAQGSSAPGLSLAIQAGIEARGWFPEAPRYRSPLAQLSFVATPMLALEWPAAFSATDAGRWTLSTSLATTMAPGAARERAAPPSGYVDLDATRLDGVGGPVDISMKPVTDAADGAAARLQPAVYVRPTTTPSSVLEREPFSPGLGQGGSPDIFGSVALAAGHTPEEAKWRRVAGFVPVGAGPWSAVLAQARRQSAREQLETVNAWVNHAIAYMPDAANYGVVDYWGTARESLTRGRGDCKDYAITKMELLRALGVPSDDLYLVLVKDLVRRQDHAILAVRLDGRFVVLDSGFDGVMDANDVRDYRPILTYSGARTWVHGYRRTANLMVASASGPATLAQ